MGGFESSFDVVTGGAGFIGSHLVPTGFFAPGLEPVEHASVNRDWSGNGTLANVMNPDAPA
jgi:hypothetical protein